MIKYFNQFLYENRAPEESPEGNWIIGMPLGARKPLDQSAIESPKGNASGRKYIMTKRFEVYPDLDAGDALYSSDKLPAGTEITANDTYTDKEFESEEAMAAEVNAFNGKPTDMFINQYSIWQCDEDPIELPDGTYKIYSFHPYFETDEEAISFSKLIK